MGILDIVSGLVGLRAIGSRHGPWKVGGYLAATGALHGAGQYAHLLTEPKSDTTNGKLVIGPLDQTMHVGLAFLLHHATAVDNTTAQIKVWQAEPVAANDNAEFRAPLKAAFDLTSGATLAASGSLVLPSSVSGGQWGLVDTIAPSLDHTPAPGIQVDGEPDDWAGCWWDLHSGRYLIVEGRVNGGGLTADGLIVLCRQF